MSVGQCFRATTRVTRCRTSAIVASTATRRGHAGLSRTITTADNSWFSQLTLNPNPLHIDHHYAARTRFGRPLVNSCFT